MVTPTTVGALWRIGWFDRLTRVKGFVGCFCLNFGNANIFSHGHVQVACFSEWVVYVVLNKNVPLMWELYLQLSSIPVTQVHLVCWWSLKRWHSPMLVY